MGNLFGRKKPTGRITCPKCGGFGKTKLYPICPACEGAGTIPYTKPKTRREESYTPIISGGLNP